MVDIAMLKAALSVLTESCFKKVNFRLHNNMTESVPVQELKLHSLPSVLHCVWLL